MRYAEVVVVLDILATVMRTDGGLSRDIFVKLVVAVHDEMASNKEEWDTNINVPRKAMLWSIDAHDEGHRL